ncbi:hypothetical protein [Halomonas dongshanensis]|nr:hypothetical protein [Halomonas dongshanensis]
MKTQHPVGFRFLVKSAIVPDERINVVPTADVGESMNARCRR